MKKISNHSYAAPKGISNIEYFLFLCGYHEISTPLPKGSPLISYCLAAGPGTLCRLMLKLSTELLCHFFALYLFCQRSCVIMRNGFSLCFDKFFPFSWNSNRFLWYNIVISPPFLFFLWNIIINSNAPISFWWTACIMPNTSNYICMRSCYIFRKMRKIYFGKFHKLHWTTVHHTTSLLQAVDYYFGIRNRKKTSSLIVVI